MSKTRFKKPLLLLAAVLLATSLLVGLAGAAVTITATKTDTLLVDNDGNGEADPGDVISYTVTITNAGDTAATNVICANIGGGTAALENTFSASAGFQSSGRMQLTPYESGALPGQKQAAGLASPLRSGETINVTLGTLDPGQEVTIEFRATVDDPLNPVTTVQVCNQGTISGSNFSKVVTDDPDGAGGEDQTCTSLDVTADLVVAKSATPQPVAAGETLTYTITITNNGSSDAHNVVATDNLPDTLSLVKSSGCAEDPTGAPTCSLGTIAANSTAHYTLTTLVDSDILPPSGSDTGTIRNTVSITATTPEAAPGDETDSIDTTVNIVADLELGKTDFPDPVEAGAPLTYTLTLTNHGPSQGWGVYVVDHLPSDFTYTGNNCGEFYLPPNPLRWTINAIAAGAVRTCVITGIVDPDFSGVLANNASVGHISFVHDPNPDNNRVQEPTTVAATLFDIGDVTLTEGDSGTTGFTFTISRTNTTTAAAVDYGTIDDTALAGQDYTPISQTVNFASGGMLTKTVTVDVAGDTLVEPDETFFLTLSNPVNGAIRNGQGTGTITNDDSNGLYLPIIFKEFSSPAGLPDLVVTDFTATPLGGRSYRFEVTVTNNGPAVTFGNNFHVAVYDVADLNTPLFFWGVQGSSLGAGQSVQLTQDYTFSGPVTTDLRAWADPFNVVAEFDDTNNTRDLPIVVTGPAVDEVQPDRRTLPAGPLPTPTITP